MPGDKLTISNEDAPRRGQQLKQVEQTKKRRRTSEMRPTQTGRPGAILSALNVEPRFTDVPEGRTCLVCSL